MTWTYTADPTSSDIDAIRLLIGDTVSTDPQLSDEELQWFLDTEGSVNGAAAAAVRSLIAKYARLVDKSVGDLSLSYSQRVAAYKALLATIERRQAIGSAAPVVGGISRSRKDEVDADSDRVEPAFKRDQFAYPGTRGRDPLDDELL